MASSTLPRAKGQFKKKGDLTPQILKFKHHLQFYSKTY